MRSLKDYLALNYPVTLYRDEEGDYIAEIGDLQGCVTHGSTSSEALESLEQAKRVWMESRLAAGLEIPKPRRNEDYSGKMLLRMPRYLHQRLSQNASAEGVSLNQYLVALLSEAAGSSQSGVRQAQRGFASPAERTPRTKAPATRPDDRGSFHNL
jgi:antitoxin HicB